MQSNRYTRGIFLFKNEQFATISYFLWSKLSFFFYNLERQLLNSLDMLSDKLLFDASRLCIIRINGHVSRCLRLEDDYFCGNFQVSVFVNNCIVKYLMRIKNFKMRNVLIWKTPPSVVYLDITSSQTPGKSELSEV